MLRQSGKAPPPRVSLRQSEASSMKALTALWLPPKLLVRAREIASCHMSARAPSKDRVQVVVAALRGSMMTVQQAKMFYMVGTSLLAIACRLIGACLWLST